MAAARFLGKKDSIIGSLMKLHYSSSPYVHSAARLSSSAFQPPPLQGRDAVKERRREEMDEKSASKYVADTAKEGVRKATKIADAAGDGATKTLDAAWASVKDANHKIRETIQDNDDNNNNEEDPFVDQMQKLDGPVDTVEYRNMVTNFKP